MSDMSINGPVFWMRAGWWTDTPVQKLWGLPVWLNSVSVTGIVALSSPRRPRTNMSEKSVFIFSFDPTVFRDNYLSLSFLISPICLMPSLSSISSCTLGMSMCNRGPWGGPFTGVSKLRLFLLIKSFKTRKHKHSLFKSKQKTRLEKLFEVKLWYIFLSDLWYEKLEMTECLTWSASLLGFWHLKGADSTISFFMEQKYFLPCNKFQN